MYSPMEPGNRFKKADKYSKKTGFDSSQTEDHNQTARRIGVATLEKSENKQDDLKNKYGKEETITKPGIGLLIFGVFLPVVAMLYEHNSHNMARAFFDPFPTINHYLLFGLIPISNLFTWLAARTKITAVYSITALTSGMSLGIAILYSLMLLPMTPLFIFAFPLGMLGLAPLASIPYTLQAGKIICQLAGRHDTFFDPHQFKHLGHVIVLVMVIAVELPSTLTRIHLTDANQFDAAKTSEAVSWLRDWGDKEVMLRACYERSGRATDLIGSLYEHQHPIPIEKARELYYRVTGVPFNSMPIPASFRSTIQHNGLISDPARLNAGAVDEFDLDPDIAGEMVQGVARGLSVSDSSFTGKIDADALLATMDWTINFTNISTVPREARAKILLPKDAVVTRATMWIDGIEKEAKITGRQQARITYQRAVTSHKRDPLLVSMQGKDTVLSQFYPVLKGSDTKVRLHIAVPMKSIANKASFGLPSFAERNFAYSKPHKISFNSRTSFKLNDKASSPQTDREIGGQSISVNLDNKQLARYEAQVVATRNPAIKFALVDRQPVPVNLNRNTFERPKKLTILVDKSISMAPYIEQVNSGIEELIKKEKDIKFYLIEVTGTGPNPLTQYGGQDNLLEQSLGSKNRAPNKQIAIDEALQSLTKNPCQGGTIDSGAISTIVSTNFRSKENGFGDILWIHAAQPVASSTDKQTIETRAGDMNTVIYDLQVASGPNALFDKSSMVKNFVRLEAGPNLDKSIKELGSLWSLETNSSATYDQTSNASTSTIAPAPEFKQLRAYMEVLDKYYGKDPYGAAHLAVTNHIITPVSSAVVTDDKLIDKYDAKSEATREALNQGRPLSKARRFFSLDSLKNNVDSLSSAASNYPQVANMESFPSYSGIRQKSSKLYHKAMPLRRYPSSPIMEGQSIGGSKGDMSYRGAYDKESAMRAEEASEPAHSREAKKEANFKASGTAGGLVGAPLYPRYGQSNEVGQLADRAFSPTLQAATNGTIHSMQAKDDLIGQEQIASDEASSELDAGKAQEKSMIDKLKAEVVPEPETNLMIALLFMALTLGCFFLQKPKENTANGK